MKRLVALVVAAGAFVGFAVDPVTIAAGSTVTITDENVADYAGGISFADTAGRAVFQTTDAPTMPFTGKAGTVVKDTEATWSLVTDQAKFTGTWDFTKGITQIKAVNVLGSTSTKSNIFVRAGASLVFDYANFQFGTHVLHLAGRGADGKGALFMNVSSSKTDCLKHIYLDDDAMIGMAASQYLFFHTDYSHRDIELNGHDLTLNLPGGSGSFYQIAPSYVIGSGRVLLTNDLTNGNYTGWSLRGGYLLDPSVEFVLANQTRLYMFNHSPTNFLAKMTVLENADAAFEHAHQFKSVLDDTGTVTNGTGFVTHDGTQNFWSGPVELREGATLHVGSSKYSAEPTSMRTNYIIGIDGPISGAGNLGLATKYFTEGVIVISCPTNTYTGTTTIDTATGDAHVILAYSNSVSGYAKTTIKGPNVFLPIKADDSTWPTECWAKFLAEATFEKQCGLLLDNRALDTWTISGAAIDAGFKPTDGRVCEPIPLGTGKVTVTLPMTNAITPYVPEANAEFAFSGEGAVRLAMGRVHTYHPTQGTIALEDGAELTPTNYPFYISDKYGLGKVAFRGGTYTNVSVETITNTTAYNQYAVRIGQTGDQKGGRLFIGEGSVITGKIQVAHDSASIGCIQQTGGQVALVGTHEDSVPLGGSLGMYGHSYYELADGELTFMGCQRMANGGNSVSMIHQKGGTISNLKILPTSPSPFFNVGFGNIAASLRFSGGTANFDYILLGRGSGKCNQITFDGGTVKCSVGLHGGYSSGPVYVNFNGGEYTGTLKRRFSVKQGVENKWFAQEFLNFNGGTWRCGENGSALGKPMPATAEERAVCTDNQPPSKVTLYARGGTVDANGHWVSFYMPFTSAEGKGLGSIPWEPRTGFVAPPAVVITGDGSNACAVAEFDVATGTVTGFAVTCPGEGYTTATANLYISEKIIESIDCTDALVDNVAGPITYAATKNSGYIQLYATNTYTGGVVVDMGSLDLEVCADGIIPDGNDLVMKSGRLQMNNHPFFKVKALTLAGGTIAGTADDIEAETLVASAGETTLPCGIKLTGTAQTISVDDLLAGRCWTVPTTLTFAKDTTLTVTGDFDKLNPKTRYTVAVAPSITNCPALAIEDEEAQGTPWYLRVYSGKLQLVYPQGSIIRFR